MTKILIAVIVFLALTVIVAFMCLKRQKSVSENEIREREKNLKDDFNRKCEKVSEVISNAGKEKDKIRTGDSNLNFSNSLDVLHKHAESGKSGGKAGSDTDSVSKSL